MEENMKVRFYRGPYDGKVKNVSDAYTRQVIEVVGTKRQQWPFVNYDNPWDTIDLRRETYSMKMMTVTIDGRTYTAPAMHPDGSIYFEWDKPRGSRK